MDTIDPEVRADVEFAARLLGKAISRRQAAEGLQVRRGSWGARAPCQFVVLLHSMYQLAANRAGNQTVCGA